MFTGGAFDPWPNSPPCPAPADQSQPFVDSGGLHLLHPLERAHGLPGADERVSIRPDGFGIRGSRVEALSSKSGYCASMEAAGEWIPGRFLGFVIPRRRLGGGLDLGFGAGLRGELETARKLPLVVLMPSIYQGKPIYVSSKGHPRLLADALGRGGVCRVACVAFHEDCAVQTALAASVDTLLHFAWMLGL